MKTLDQPQSNPHLQIVKGVKLKKKKVMAPLLKLAGKLGIPDALSSEVLKNGGA